MVPQGTRGATREGGGARLVNVGIDMNVAPSCPAEVSAARTLGIEREKGI